MHERWLRFEDAFLERAPLPRPVGKLVLGLLLAALISLLAAGALVGLDLAVSHSEGLALIAALATVALTGFLVIVTKYYEFWVPWTLDDRRFSDVYGSVMLAFAALTVGTVAIGVLLYLGNWIDAIWVPPDEGGRAQTPTTDPLTRGGLTALSGEFFVWNFLDGIPVLKITESLNWNRDRTFTDHYSGSLLLLYKLAVVIPIVALVVHSLRAPKAESA